MQHPIRITEHYLIRLRPLLESARRLLPGDRQYLELLNEKLEMAEIVEEERVPAEQATINSTLRFTNLDTGQKGQYKLVFPRDARLEENRVSVLSPLGAALFGHLSGDVVEWTAPGGRKHFRLEEVNQEASASERESHAGGKAA